MNTTSQENQVINIPIEDIIPNRFQPRLTFDDNSLKELAASIKEHGIIQPLILRRLGDKYEIIAGERRYKAAKLAGLMSVPAIISQMNDNESAEVAIVENVQRKDLSAIEEAKSYKALLDKGYLTQEELAKKMGLSQSAVSNKLRLLTLPEEVQNALIENKISERHARSLLQLGSSEEQINWLKTILDERLTVRDLDKKIKETMNKTTSGDEIPIIDPVPNIADIRKNAEDIVSVNNPINNQNVTNPTDDSQKPMPNKFFNFLEDESVNMGVPDSNIKPVTEQVTQSTAPVQNILEGQPKIDLDAPVVPLVSSDTDEDNDSGKTLELEKNIIEEPKEKIEEQNSDNTTKLPLDNVQSEPEEIEMLDFLAPTESKNDISLSNEVDMTTANVLINKLEDDLRANNYRISIVKENDVKEIRYTITIDK